MGCDIHAYIETYIDGKWVFNDTSRYPDQSNPYYDCTRFPQDRNYLFFSFLAGVRSYGDCAPYREARGIPDDCSNEVMKQWENAKEWNHTPSWYDIDDLIYGIENYDGLFKTLMLVTKDDADKYAGVWDKLPPEMLILHEKEWTVKDDNKLTNINVHLPFKYIIDKPTLNQIIEIRDEDVFNKSRVVFWFDN